MPTGYYRVNTPVTLRGGELLTTARALHWSSSRAHAHHPWHKGDVPGAELYTNNNKTSNTPADTTTYTICTSYYSTIQPLQKRIHLADSSDRLLPPKEKQIHGFPIPKGTQPGGGGQENILSLH